MKKTIYFLGAFVIALNLLFNVTLNNDITIDSANANENEGLCASFIDSYEGYRTVILSGCVDEEGPCGISTICDPAASETCDAYICDVII